MLRLLWEGNLSRRYHCKPYYASWTVYMLDCTLCTGKPCFIVLQPRSSQPWYGFLWKPASWMPGAARSCTPLSACARPALKAIAWTSPACLVLGPSLHSPSAMAANKSTPGGQHAVLSLASSSVQRSKGQVPDVNDWIGACMTVPTLVPRANCLLADSGGNPLGTD